MRALAGAVRAAFPLACAGCAGPLDGARDWPLCPPCEAGLPEAGERFCLTCARTGGSPRACVRPSHLGLRAAWVWSPAVRGLVHAYKFGDAPELAEGLVARAWATAAFARGPRPDLLLPVPLHALRRRERGYDQAARLAGAWSERAGAPVAAALERARRTQQQARLGARARALNVRGAFRALRPELVEGRRVALVDDVVTTGETLVAAEQALRAAGALRVEAWALAFEPLE
jgi:ComF family protein